VVVVVEDVVVADDVVDPEVVVCDADEVEAELDVVDAVVVVALDADEVDEELDVADPIVSSYAATPATTRIMTIPIAAIVRETPARLFRRCI
jgi:hypothetical protein